MDREKQEKQEKSQEKQESSSSETDVIPEITLEEAETRIFELIQSGKQYREIAKVGFNIRGKGFHRFSIAEISRIKNRFNSKTEQNLVIKDNKNVEMAEVFQLADQGLNAIQIVSQTEKHPDFVLLCFQKRLQLKGYSPDFAERIFSTFSEWGYACSYENELFEKLDNVLNGYSFLDSLKFRCSKCGKPVLLNPLNDMNKKYRDDCMEDWRYALAFLSRNNVHPYCAN